jgi:ATP-dependent DNA helicase DinG
VQWDKVVETLKTKLPNYQERENQNAFGRAAEVSFEAERHLLAQMGCGTGKSFVNAAAAYRRSILTGKPVGISTGTKALQDQYAEQDLPFLSDKVIPGLKFVVLKGRANYLCMAKLDESKDFALTQAAKAAVDDPDFSGEISDTSIPVDRHSEMVATSDECPGKKDCPFGNVCFAERAKTRAKDAHIVIVNHAVMAADMAVKEAQRNLGVPLDKTSGIMPHLSGVVIDEGHEFEDSIRNALGGQLTSGSFGRLTKELKNFFSDRNAGKAIDTEVEKLFREVSLLLRLRSDKRNRTYRLDDNALTAIGENIISLIEHLNVIDTQLEGATIYGDDKANQKKKRLQRRVSSLADKLTSILAAEDEQLVRWIEEGQGRRGDSISWAPQTVNEFLKRNLWDNIPAVITSATLTVGPSSQTCDFDFIASNLGIEDYDGIDGGTSFEFKRQARTFIPNIPVPAGATQGQWRSTALAMSKRLVEASGGRALLLFTSKDNMVESFNAMQPLLQRMNVKGYMQGGELTNKQLKVAFAADETSVLFALKSFMTGVDFQGNTLRLVILDKLPFPVPTDVVLAARVALADKRYGQWAPKGGFNGIVVPLMALLILQIYGRLIRTIEDHGMVAILDSRLYGPQSKNYGGRIMSLHPISEVPVITELDEAETYLKGLAV